MQIDFDRIVQAHNAIRDARTVRRHAYEKEDAELELEQQRLKAFMLEHLNKTNTKSISTDHGTIYRSLKVKPSAADWGAIWDWMRENDGIDLLERRIKATFVKDFMEANDGALPPGVNVIREFEVSVRRNNTGGSSGTAED